MSTAHSAQIHDLGYRGYDGQRLGEGAVARALFVLGLRHAFGLGRPVKARILPIAILLISLVPVLVMVAITAMAPGGFKQLPVSYSSYPMLLQTVTSVFVAAQAPVIFSRDLRDRVLTLYLARPMRRATYVAARLASLFTATLIVVGLPVLVLWLGGMLAGMPWHDESVAAAKAVPGILVLCLALTVLTGTVACLISRHGLAVVTSIAVLSGGMGVAHALAEVLQGGVSTGGIHTSWPALLNPFLLVAALQHWWFGFDLEFPPPEGADGWILLVGFLVLLAAGLTIIQRRYAKAGAA